MKRAAKATSERHTLPGKQKLLHDGMRHKVLLPFALCPYDEWTHASSSASMYAAAEGLTHGSFLLAQDIRQLKTVLRYETFSRVSEVRANS